MTPAGGAAVDRDAERECDHGPADGSRARAEGRATAADRIEHTVRPDDEHVRLLRAAFLEASPGRTA